MFNKNILTISFLLLGGYLLPTYAQNPCSCADKKDLLNRLNVVEAAIVEYRKQIEVIKGQEKTEGKSVILTDERYNEILQPRINDAIKMVKDPTANSGTAKTNGGDCELEHITAPTNCLLESLARHEKVHQRACLAVFQDTPAFPNETYQTRMRLADYAQEEIFAYLEERKFILQTLQSLPKLCRPNNWFGYVAYQKTKTMETQKTIPSKNTQYKGPSAGISIINGGSETSTSKNIYLGTLFVEEGKAASARGFASWDYVNNKIVNGRIYCSPKKPDMPTTMKSGVNSSGEGEKTNNAQFTINLFPANGEYRIYMSFFPVTVTGQTTIYSNVTGGCYEESPTTTNPLTLNENTDPYTIEGKIKPDSPDYLVGSKNEKPPLLQSSNSQGNMSLNITYEITTSWMLRRLPTR